MTLTALPLTLQSKVFTFTSRPFQGAGLPREGGVKKTLYLWSNRWDSNLDPFGLQSNALLDHSVTP